MKDLKHLLYFENLLQEAQNELILQAQSEGDICVAYVCENTPEPLLNLPGAFSTRLRARPALRAARCCSSPWPAPCSASPMTSPCRSSASASSSASFRTPSRPPSTPHPMRCSPPSRSSSSGARPARRSSSEPITEIVAAPHALSRETLLFSAAFVKSTRSPAGFLKKSGNFLDFPTAIL